MVFAGALRYPRYSWLDRTMIKMIMKMTGGETDTTKEVEYTDWQQVDRFARDFARFVSTLAKKLHKTWVLLKKNERYKF